MNKKTDNKGMITPEWAKEYEQGIRQDFPLAIAKKMLVIELEIQNILEPIEVERNMNINDPATELHFQKVIAEMVKAWAMLAQVFHTATAPALKGRIIQEAKP